jgi:hypothetical protein
LSLLNSHTHGLQSFFRSDLSDLGGIRQAKWTMVRGS